MKKFLLVLLSMVLIVSICGCKKSETLTAAEDAIKAIGTVTLDSDTAIKNAENAVSKLTEEDKKKFKMNDVLVEAKNEYDKLVLEKQVSDVEKIISEMGEVSLSNLENVDNAQKEYDKLSTEAKALVKNYGTLESAQKTLSEEKKAKDNVYMVKSDALKPADTVGSDSDTIIVHTNDSKHMTKQRKISL